VAPARLDMPQPALRPAAIAGPVHCPWCVRSVVCMSRFAWLLSLYPSDSACVCVVSN